MIIHIELDPLGGVQIKVVVEEGSSLREVRDEHWLYFASIRPARSESLLWGIFCF
jgi:hypothetical protein